MRDRYLSRLKLGKQSPEYKRVKQHIYAIIIVTFNERDFGSAAQQFGIEVIQPGVLVRKLNLRERLSQ